jgi:hypothetical protein
MNPTCQAIRRSAYRKACLGAAIMAVAWLIFVASFFLPATNRLQVAGAPPGTPLTGWQALTVSIETAMSVWGLVAVVADPTALVFLVFPIANAAMLLAPLLIAAWDEHSAALAGLFVPCAIIPWFLPKTLSGDLFIGFYCWDASFLLMSLGCALWPWLGEAFFRQKCRWSAD